MFAKFTDGNICSALQTAVIHSDKHPTNICSVLPIAKPMTGCQINTLTIKIIFSDFMSSHCVQTHPTFAFLWIGATAHECCAVRHWQVLLFQQVTVHSLHVTSEHIAVPWKYSVSQHGSQKNVLHTSTSSTTFNKKCTPVQKISPQHTAMLQTYVQKYL